MTSCETYSIGTIQSSSSTRRTKRAFLCLQGMSCTGNGDVPRLSLLQIGRAVGSEPNVEYRASYSPSFKSTSRSKVTGEHELA